MIWKARKMCRYWQICKDHQQKEDFVTNMGKLEDLSSLKTTISTWGAKTKEIEWLIPIQLVREQWSEQKIFYFLDLTTLNSSIILSYCSSKTDHRKNFIQLWFKTCCSECKRVSPSIHPQRNTKHTSWLNDIPRCLIYRVWARCRIVPAVLCVHTQWGINKQLVNSSAPSAMSKLAFVQSVF
jgi:hypothetical protein